MITSDPFGFRKDVELFRSKMAQYPFSENDLNLLVSIFKQACLYNTVVSFNDGLYHRNFLKSIVYDVMNAIIAITDRRERYVQLNIRSSVEHIARIALNKEYQGGEFDETVRRKDFSFLKEKKNKEVWSYLHNVYIRACYFVHSSPKAKLKIFSSYSELEHGDTKFNHSNTVKNLHKLVNHITIIFLTYYLGDIEDSFFRTKSELKFLLSRNMYHKHFS